MNYLLDTCLISELVKSRPDISVLKWLNNCNEESLYICVLTIGEIQKGISKVKDQKRKEILENWLNYDLKERFKNRIIDIDLKIAFEWGKIHGEAEKNGYKFPAIDSLIAATCSVNNLTVVTRNYDDYKNTGINILNPWEID